MLLRAGECFMYLLLVESVMCDFIALKEGGSEMIKNYNRAYGKSPLPSDFSTARLELATHSFTKIKDKFLDLWPNWSNNSDVYESMKRVVIMRNALSHAHVQPFRNFLLYSPTNWDSIDRFMVCGKCLETVGNCSCSRSDRSLPLCMKLDMNAIYMTFADIKKIDLECLYLTAKKMNIEYQGVAWPDEKGEFTIAKTNFHV